MEISLKHIPIHPMLQGQIEKIWVLEASGGIPDKDMRLVVPNGMMKLIIPFKNEFVARHGSYSKHSKLNQLTVVGVNDIPFFVDTKENAATGTIGIEFSPHAAYRFFPVNKIQLKNQMYDSTEIMGKEGLEIEDRMATTEVVEEKLKFLQQFLLKLFHKTESDGIFEYCINIIRNNRGNISVKDLERRTGYSARWLNMKFEERIGISPKNLCAISRFQFVYQSLVNNPNELLSERSYYNIYYDQSHFIKEFKRFTGLPPTKFGRVNSSFSNISYLK